MTDVRATYDPTGFLHTVGFTDDGRRYACEIDGGPIAAGTPARPALARWRVTVDGRDLGTLFDAELGETPVSVRARVLAAAPPRAGRPA